MLIADGICPALAARTVEPSYSDFERESTIMTALLLLFSSFLLLILSA